MQTLFLPENKLTIQEIALIMRCLMDSLGWLHKNNVIHRDVKISNFLISPPSLSEDSHWQCRLIDFGLSAEPSERTCGVVGTPGYQAPEMFDSILHTTKIDIFSAGVLFWALLSRKKNPFEDRIGVTRAIDTLFYNSSKPLSEEHIRTIDILDFETFNNNYSFGCTAHGYDLLIKMLNPCYHSRISAEDALQLPFLKDAHIE